MPTTPSPLRYPGGKTKLYNKVTSILRQNGLVNYTYVEPFAGGCGLAIKLLLCKDVSNIIINDVDPAIFAFWYSVLNNTEELVSRLMDCKITIQERDEQIKILTDMSKHSNLDIGFATLFLNRTNVSGILSAGPIGGKDQTGKDKLSARFNKTVLGDKINTIAALKDKISLYSLDVIDFITTILPTYCSKNIFINFDPPYVKKGPALYLNHFDISDHRRLFKEVSQCKHHWIVTYDYNDIILNLYSSFEHERIQLNHSTGRMKIGQEIIIYSHSLLPDEENKKVTL